MKFADDQIEEMLRRMREGEPLMKIAEDPRMPSVDSMNRWEDDPGHEHAAAITRARRQGVDARMEKALLKAVEAKDAGLGRLAWDAERWYASKINPRKYADKLDVTTAGDKLPATLLPLTGLSEAALREIAALEGKHDA